MSAITLETVNTPQAPSEAQAGMPRVLNTHRDAALIRESAAVYIGRPSPWGNPFQIGRHGTREQVVARYEAWLLAQPKLITEAQARLRGRHLVCFCAPLPCHGDVLLRVANQPLPPKIDPDYTQHTH